VIPDRSTSPDMAALRRFEPVIRYTRGERFFPIDVDRYVSQCSFWVQRPDVPPSLLIPQGEMCLEKLVEPRLDDFGTVYYLKFIDPPDLIDFARYSLDQAIKSFTRQGAGDIFRAGKGRLARVGYGSRFVDALFSITLLMRGRVPGDTAAAAALAYRRMQSEEEHYHYYGRVVRENGWVALQYWFFYPFNNWRSGFFGVNDHEADWEMVCVYCSEEDGSESSFESRLTPQWVAYASHDFSGDDLRRRWDDPEVEKLVDPEGGQHPVIYAGAGSHASYFKRGEYLAELELPFLSPLVKLVDRIQEFWVNTLRQAGANANKPEFNVFRIPFVDYARGDGLSIGPQQDLAWQACPLDSRTPWAVEYRGLWGLYAHDPISGENAPAGPVYNRDGGVRRSWYDPMGWAGLDKVAPPDEALKVLAHQRSRHQAQCTKIKALIDQKSAELTGLGVEMDALHGHPHLVHIFHEHAGHIALLSKELSDLRQQLTVESARLEAFDLHEASLRDGDFGPLRAHIHRAHAPSSDLNLRLGGFAEVFAAVSIGLLLIGIVLLILFARDYLLVGLASMIGLLIFLEAGFRRQLERLITSLTIGLAIVSALILIYNFFWPIVVAGVLVAGLFIVWENIKELRR
jgi:hypothetical protein